jgi:hypothetical protein
MRREKAMVSSVGGMIMGEACVVAVLCEEAGMGDEGAGKIKMIFREKESVCIQMAPANS